MAFTLELPDAYPLVLLTALVGHVVNWYQVVNVSRYRNAAKVPYPLAYADSKEAQDDPAKMRFNCAQRAHQNTLEHAPFVFAATLLTGLTLPTTAIVMGLLGHVGRVMYTVGYSSGVPKNRSRGFLHHVATSGLLLTSMWSVVSLVLESPGVLARLLK